MAFFIRTQIRRRTRGRLIPSYVAAGPSTYTATSAVTIGPVSLSGSATFTKPTYSGTAGLTTGHVTLSASGTFIKPTYAGTAGLTVGYATLSGAGTFTKPTYTGSGTLTVGPTTLSGTATFTNPTYTAQAALTTGHASVSILTTFTKPQYVASSTVALASVLLSATALFSKPQYVGAGALTTSPTVLTGSGTFQAPFTTTAALLVGPVLVAGVGVVPAVTAVPGVRYVKPSARSFRAPWDTVKRFDPNVRSFVQSHPTVRIINPVARSYNIVVRDGDETMLMKSPIAPGETRQFSWVFTLGVGETINAGLTTVTAVQNCSLPFQYSSGQLGTVLTVNQLVAVAPGQQEGTQAQVKCTLITSAGRKLERTIACNVEDHQTLAGEMDPADVDDLTIRATALLAESMGVITGATCTVESGVVTLSGVSHTDKSASVRMSGAVAPGFNASFWLTTSLGEVIRETALLEVMDL